MTSKKPNIRLGHPLASMGAIYHVKDIDSLVDATTEISAARLIDQGRLVMDKDVAKIRKFTEKESRKYIRMIVRLGIPESIRSLISAHSKRDIERLAPEITISENDLFLMVHNSSQIGFSHRGKFLDFVPDHLKITEHDQQDSTRLSNPKYHKKVSSLFTFRKMVNVHLFESKTEWHCFYFTYSDVEESDENHWKKGSHIHYVSHLWPRLDSKSVWSSFDTRRGRASSGVHVKFLPFAYSSGPKKSSGLTTDDFFPINPKLVQGRLSTPFAHLLTRGSWTATVSIPSNHRRLPKSSDG